MEYILHLLEEPFRLIGSGKKTVEVRLNDAKRRHLTKGDTLVFECLSNGETIGARIKELKSFPSLQDLLESYESERLGESKTSLRKRVNYIYPLSDIERFGVLAIEIVVERGFQ